MIPWTDEVLIDRSLPSAVEYVVLSISRVILSLSCLSPSSALAKHERPWSGPHAARPSSSGRCRPDALPRTRLRGDHHRGNQRATPTCHQRPCTGSSPRSLGSSGRCSTPPSPVTTSRWRCRNGQTSPRCSPNPTRASALAGFAGVTTAINQRTNDVYHAVASAAGSDPSAAELLGEIQQQRDQGQGRIARSLSRSHALKPGLRERDAADLIYALMSPRGVSPARRRSRLDARALPRVARDHPHSTTDLNRRASRCSASRRARRRDLLEWSTMRRKGLSDVPTDSEFRFERSGAEAVDFCYHPCCTAQPRFAFGAVVVQSQVDRETSCSMHPCACRCRQQRVHPASRPECDGGSDVRRTV